MEGGRARAHASPPATAKPEFAGEVEENGRYVDACAFAGLRKKASCRGSNPRWMTRSLFVGEHDGCVHNAIAEEPVHVASDGRMQEETGSDASASRNASGGCLVRAEEAPAAGSRGRVEPGKCQALFDAGLQVKRHAEAPVSTDR